MRWPAAAAMLFTVAGCAPASAPAASPAAMATGDAVFAPYVGAYRTEAGLTLVVNGHGHLVNLQDDSIRQLTATSQRDHLTVGPGFQVAEPKQADVVFHLAGNRADRLLEAASGGATLVAPRLAFKETEVRVPAKGAVLAGTVTEPLTAGPHPGIVIVHGSGPGPRVDYGVWVGLYASLGLMVLAYDKRGNGASTGTYPGELATEANLDVYADDAAAALRFLAGWPGVDPTRLGLHGGSQGAWITPLAIQRYPTAAFALLFSGPAVTTGQQQVWADFSGGSRHLPDRPEAEMNAAVRAEHSGFDPLPLLKAEEQPMAWFNGASDRQVPTTVNTELLRGLGKSHWEINVLPGVDHGLLVNPDGLSPGEATATTLAPGLFDKIQAWLRQHVA